MDANEAEMVDAIGEVIICFSFFTLNFVGFSSILFLFLLHMVSKKS